MNSNGDLGRRLSDHYASEAPNRAPDWLLDSAIETIESTPQRRVLIRAPWRNPFMNTNAKLGAAAVIAVVLVVGGIALLRPGSSSDVGSTPSALPSAVPSAAPSALPSAAPSPAATPISIADWVPFTSERYGYRISYPPTHTGERGSTTSAPTFVAQAKRDFTFGDRFEAELENAPNDWIIVGPDGSQIALAGFATTVPSGTSVDDVIRRTFPEDVGCESEPIEIDGKPGRFDVCGDGISIAVAIVGDRAYVFAQGRGAAEKDLMLASLSTVRLPINTADWETFTSERYGYTMAYPASHPGLPGSTTSAPTQTAQATKEFQFGTDRWDGDGNASDLILIGPNDFDIALFGFATTVPAGTTVDDVIRQAVGVPDQQCESEPVTVDGHPGRLDVCGEGLSIAVAIVDDRAYVFVQGRGAQAKDLLLAHLSTVKLPAA
jgi:hypothetical protein